MSERDALLVLTDIVDAVDTITGLIGGMTFEDFAADRAVHDAVLYNPSAARPHLAGSGSWTLPGMSMTWRGIAPADTVWSTTGSGS